MSITRIQGTSSTFVVEWNLGWAQEEENKTTAQQQDKRTPASDVTSRCQLYRVSFPLFRSLCIKYMKHALIHRQVGFLVATHYNMSDCFGQRWKTMVHFDSIVTSICLSAWNNLCWSLPLLRMSEWGQRRGSELLRNNHTGEDRYIITILGTKIVLYPLRISCQNVGDPNR